MAVANITTLENMALDAKTIEDVANGSNTTVVTPRLGGSINSVAKALKALEDNGFIGNAMYANTTAGLAGTSDGQLFTIPDPSSTGALRIYLNDAGVATDTGKSLINTTVLTIKSISDLVSTTPDFIGQAGSFNGEVYISSKLSGDGAKWTKLSNNFINLKRDPVYSSGSVVRVDSTNKLNGHEADTTSLYTTTVEATDVFQGLDTSAKLTFTGSVGAASALMHFGIYKEEFESDLNFIQNRFLNFSIEVFCPIASAELKAVLYYENAAGVLQTGSPLYSVDNIPLIENGVTVLNISATIPSSDLKKLRLYFYNSGSSFASSYLRIGKFVINGGFTPSTLQNRIGQGEIDFSDITALWATRSKMLDITGGANELVIDDIFRSKTNNHNFASGAINRCTSRSNTAGDSGWFTQAELSNAGCTDEIVAITGVNEANYALRTTIADPRPAGNNVAAYLINATDADLQSGDVVSVSMMVKVSSAATISFDIAKKDEQVTFTGYSFFSTGNSQAIAADGNFHQIVAENVLVGSLDNSPYTYDGLWIWIRDLTTIAGLVVDITNVIVTKVATVPAYISRPFVTLLNSLKGDVTLAAGSNVSITPSGNTLTIASSAPTSAVVRAIKNLIYDSEFKLVSENGGGTAQQFLWWDKTIVGSSTIQSQIQPTVLESNAGNSALITTDASGANTKLTQMVWFWNHDDVRLGDVLSFSAKVKSDTIGSAKIQIEFIDRSEAVIGSAVLSTANTVADEFEELTIENQTIPVTIDVSTHDGCFGVRLSLIVTANSAVVEFAQPMCNIGDAVAPYSPSWQDFTNYHGLENTVRSLLNSEAKDIIFMGDSITHGGDTSQTGIGTGYASLIHDWVEEKFNVTIEKRNNGCDGSASPNALAILDKMAIDHDPSFVSIAVGRNVPHVQWWNGTVSQHRQMVEGMIRKIRNSSIFRDILLWLPTFTRLDSAVGSVAEYQYDQQMLRDYRFLCSLYGLGTMHANEKMRSLANRALVAWWNWFGGNSAATTEYIHPAQIGRVLWEDEFKHVISGSMLRPRSMVPMMPTQFETLAAAMQDAWTVYSDEFGVLANTAKSGSWVVDPNMNSDGTLSGVTGKTYGVGLGEFPQAIVSGAQNDYIEISWTGQHFAIWFMGCDDRGVATIDIDSGSVVYDFDTYNASGYLITVSYPLYATFLSASQNPGSISLSEGSHTLRISQKNATSTDKISVAMVMVF